ncbi:MAG: hypothetical protein WCV67_03945 [Victivallaceae bacterium]|jgi:hypothetical protein
MKKRILLLMLFLLRPPTWAENILVEHFDNKESWQILGGNVQIRPYLPGVEHTPFMALGNAAIAHKIDLNQPVKIKIKVLHSDYKRGLFIVFFDAAMTKGFGVLWDSSLESGFGGQGFVAPISFDLQSKVNAMSAYKTLEPRVASGHSAIRLPFAEFEINIITGGRMSVSVDGQQKFNVPVPVNYEIKYLVLRANTWGFFDDLEAVR